MIFLVLRNIFAAYSDEQPAKYPNTVGSFGGRRGDDTETASGRRNNCVSSEAVSSKGVCIEVLRDINFNGLKQVLITKNCKPLEETALRL